LAAVIASGVVVLMGYRLRAAATAAGRAAGQLRGWSIAEIGYRQDALRIVALGPPQSIDATHLRDQLDAAGR
jgi:hypothetical protein